MKTIEYTTIDRVAADWPSGPWDSEPDKVQWPDPETGLPCIAKRHPRSGHWCGYVGVAPGHKLHGKDYSDDGAYDLNVHGGLTYADACDAGDEAVGICHLPEAGEPEHVWWFGFDCAHHHDYSPRDVQWANERGYPFTIMEDQQYRTLQYVKNQCANLAQQLAQP